MMAPKVIAVVGSTGQQGGGAVKAILKDSAYKVRALTRNPSSDKGKALATQGCEVVAADLNDMATVTKAFEGADAVFCSTNYFEVFDVAKEFAQGKNLGDAAKAAGIKHIVWSSLEEPESETPVIKDWPRPDGKHVVPHFTGKAEITDYLNTLGVPVTTLLTSAFYQNLTGPSAAVPNEQGGKTFYHCVGDVKHAWIDVDDIGAVAFEIIKQGPEAWGGKTIGIAGDIISYNDAAAIMSEVSKSNLNAVALDNDAYTGALMGAGVPEMMARDLANMMGYFRDSATQPKGKGYNGLRSVEETAQIYPGTKTLKEWVTLNKEEISQI